MSIDAKLVELTADVVRTSTETNTQISNRCEISQGISGVLVRLTTCERITNSLPKLSLV